MSDKHLGRLKHQGKNSDLCELRTLTWVCYMVYARFCQGSTLCWQGTSGGGSSTSLSAQWFLTRLMYNDCMAVQWVSSPSLLKNHIPTIQIIVPTPADFLRLIYDCQKKNQVLLKSNLHDGINITDFTRQLFSKALNDLPRQTDFAVRQTAILVALCWNKKKKNSHVNKTHLDHVVTLPRLFVFQFPNYLAPLRQKSWIRQHTLLN